MMLKVYYDDLCFLCVICLGNGGNEWEAAGGGGDWDCPGEAPRQEEERAPGSPSDHQEYRVRSTNGPDLSSWMPGDGYDNI